MNIYLELFANKECSAIESNKSFQRLSEKTQVLVPEIGRDEVTRSRITHSYEVVTSATEMAANVAQNLGLNKISDIDYKQTLKQACLLHDIGHPPFGHDGAGIINDFFIDHGLQEGFSDNNNNYKVIDKNSIAVRDDVLVDILKYPDKLYDDQKYLIGILEKSINDDIKHMKTLGVNYNGAKHTITCQIMDEADENSYSTSDIVDYLCLGGKLDRNMIDAIGYTPKGEAKKYYDMFTNSAESGNNDYVRKVMNHIKSVFNSNYELGVDGIIPIDKDIHDFKKLLKATTLRYYIKPVRTEEFHLGNVSKLNKFMNMVVNEGLITSNRYGKMMLESTSPTEKLKIQRDMIAEASDWFIIKEKYLNYINNKPIKRMRHTI